MNKPKLTESMQDYLETIYIIVSDKPVCRVTDITDMMKVSKPSVVRALSVLKKKGMIDKEPYGYITLTAAGKKCGEELLGKHRTLSDFLKTFFDMSNEQSDKLACELEHHFDKTAIGKMRKINKNLLSDKTLLKKIKE